MPERPDGPLRPSGPPLGGDREIVYRKPRSWFRRHLSVVVTVAVVVVVLGVVVGAVLAVRNVGDVAAVDPSGLITSSAPPTAAAAPATTAARSATPTSTAATATQLTGAVTAVVGPGQWTVQAQKDLDISVVTTSKTTYAKGKSAQDVTEGSTISVTGTMADGVVTATSVTIEKKTSS